MKGVSVLISAAIIIMVTVSAIGIVLTVINPAIQRAQAQATINEATDSMRLLDTIIRQVASEGTGALRSLTLRVNDGSFIVRNSTGIEYILDTDYNSIPVRSLIKEGNIRTTSGFTALGLVGYWKFDAGGGTVANDSSGKGNDGTLGNGSAFTIPTWTNGKYDNALSFNGSQFIIIPNSDSLSIYKGITIEAWIKTNSSKQWQWIVSKREIYAAGNESGYELEYAGNTDDFYLAIRNTSIVFGFYKSIGLRDNAWHHVVGTFDGSEVKVYKNGAFLNSTASNLNIGTNKQNVYIGHRTNDTGNFYFNGTIEEVKIYNRALNSSEIQDDYNLPSNKLKISLDYDNIIIKGTDSWRKGETKVCVERLGTQSGKALVEVRAC